MSRRLWPLLLLVLFNLALAKSYSLKNVIQDVFFNPDGTVKVEDTRTLVLDGDFSGNTYHVKVVPASGGSIHFQGVQALDGKTPAQAEISGDTIAWKVHGVNETRTFRFSYVLTNELKVASDAALFDRQLLEPGPVPIAGYTLRLHPPAASPNLFKVFIFTPTGRIGTLDINQATTLATVHFDQLEQGEAVRSRVLLEPTLFDFKNVDKAMLDTWLGETAQETAAFRRASENALGSRAHPASPLWLVLVWGVVVLLGYWVLRDYLTFGREPKTLEVGPYYHEPAEKIPPAAVPFVITQNPPGVSAAGPAVASTLLDFARRGYLTLHTTHKDGFLGIGGGEEVTYRLAKEPQAGELTPFESDLWGAFKGAAGSSGRSSLARSPSGAASADAPTFDADDLRDYFKNRPNFAKNWVKEPREWYETTHGKLLDADAGRRAGPVAAACSLVAMALGFIGFSVIGPSPLLGANMIAAAALAFILSVSAAKSLKRWMPDKLLNAKRWQAYRHFLSDFSLMRKAPAEHYKLWDYHFVYATALGVSKQYLHNLRALMREEPDRFSMPLWLAGSYALAGPQASALNSLDTLTQSLNTLSQVETNLTALNSALSPSSSTGGGFSGGGFGGGGFSGGGGSSGMS